MKSSPLYSLIAIFSFSFVTLNAQTPAPTQQPTGKSYVAAEIKRPTTTAPQFPSPVTFTDVTAQTKIDFRHYSSPTSQKYLLETMSAG
ncbi:MAG: hypothetical protein H0X15_04680, partial [Acidobacteria bacterium]|nr:hypothetical protein [Acidobacteriota bacterium]